MSAVKKTIGVLVSAAALTLGLAACGSDDSTASSTGTETLTTAPAQTQTTDAATSCPTADPGAQTAPEWDFRGTTGSVRVTGSTDTAAPRIDVETPFAVTETKVQTLRAGTGEVVPETATVNVCYEGVNGRDGKLFDSSYQRGEPVKFPLDGVVTGFKKAIAGQRVGSTVAVAMQPSDGYPDGNPNAGIQKGDTLIFAIKILAITG